MATKKCANGHLYDAAIYHDQCPFCPSSSEKKTKVVSGDEEDGKTRPIKDYDPVEPTIPINDDEGGRTVIRPVGPDGTSVNEAGGRRMVGLLVSYSASPAGEVFKVYEGRTTIGRDRTCDIPFPGDKNMSSHHLLIQYVSAKGAFRAQEYDKGSSNGTYINGQVYVLGDVVDLKDKDVLVVGGTKFVFLAIPEF